MLYTLKRLSEGVPSDQVLHLIKGQKYVVGRKGADILIEGDLSISRKHAVLQVGPESVTLTDCKSKYGTVCNGQKLDPDVAVTLNDNDQIKFGVYQSNYVIQGISVVTIGSGLKAAQKDDLKKLITSIGGNLESTWTPNCTHLTVEELLLTIKVLNAIVDEKPVVTVDFWKAFLQSITKNQPLPKSQDFKPPLNESLLSEGALNVNANRKELFKDKIFVFPDKKLRDKMNEIIEKCGGSSISYDENLPEIDVSSNIYLFVNDEQPGEIPAPLKKVHENLMGTGRRTIPIREIARAIYLCSCEKDCNPLFNRLQEVFNVKKEEPNLEDLITLAPETESQDFSKVYPKQEIVIPGSFEPELSDLIPLARNVSCKKENIVSRDAGESTSTTTNQKNSRSEGSYESENAPPSKRIKVNTTLELERPLQKKGTEQASTSELNKSKRKQDSVEQSVEEVEENPFKRPKKQLTTTSNIFSLKRKQADLEAPNTKKKSTVIAESPQSDDNPFASFKIRKDTRQDYNSFKISSSKSNDKVSKPGTSSGDVSLVNEAPSLSNICDTFETSSLSESKWLSKSRCSTIKSQIKIEDDLKYIYDKFRDSVIVETIKIAPRRLNSSEVDSSLRNNGSGKNYKKFRKVAPINPQINIVSASISKTAGPKTSDIASRSDGEEDDDDEDDSPRPTLKTKRSKQFKF